MRCIPATTATSRSPRAAATAARPRTGVFPEQVELRFRRRGADVDHRPIATTTPTRAATSTTAPSTSSIASRRRSAGGSRRSARNSGSRAMRSTTSSTGWSALITPTRRLKLTDNLHFGDQYGRFATCRIVSPGGLSAALLVRTRACHAVGGLPIAPRPALFGPASPLVFAGVRQSRCDSNDLGSTTDTYNQKSRNWALFTHNIFHVTPQIDVTVGLRYTNERKKFDATFGNDNTVCVANQALLAQFVDPASPAFQTGGLFTVSQAHPQPVLPGQFDRRAQRRVDRRQAQGGQVHRHGRPVLQAERRPAALRQLSRAATRRAASTSTARRSRHRRLPFARRGRRSGAGRQPAVRSGNVDAFEIGGKYSRRGITLQRRIVPPGLQELPAEHVRRHRLHRPEHQRLRKRISAAPTATRASTLDRPISSRRSFSRARRSISIPAAEHRPVRRGRRRLGRAVAGRRARSIGPSDARPHGSTLGFT